MSVLNLPIELLRTFITVVDLGGYTKAGVALGRTQPAVSLQMRRLEELVGAKLVAIDGRMPRLTSTGETLVGYAREMLRLNDEVAARFDRSRAERELRVGLPLDYAVAFLQNVVADFAKSESDLTLAVRCDLSSTIRELLAAGTIDVAVALIGRRTLPYLSRVWVEQPVWVAADSASTQEDPVALVAHPEGCEYRRRMIDALQLAGRHWRVVFSSPGISGLQRAVGSGLGVSALTKGTLLDGMRVLSPSEGFPALEDVRIGLFHRHPRMTAAGLRLTEEIATRLDDAGFCRPEDRGGRAAPSRHVAHIF